MDDTYLRIAPVDQQRADAQPDERDRPDDPAPGEQACARRERVIQQRVELAAVLVTQGGRRRLRREQPVAKVGRRVGRHDRLHRRN